MFDNNDDIKKLFKEKPPYVLKFWNHSNEKISNCDEECSKTIGPYAMQLSSRLYDFK